MADNAAAMAALTAQIERLRSLGETPKAIAAEAAPGIEAAITAQVAAATTPYGAAWQPRQDGGAPLQQAASQIVVRAVGPEVVARLTGPAVRHHSGTARGRITRRVLPSKVLPPTWIAVIAAAGVKIFARSLTGKG